jgi:hypothetical protein
MYWPALSLFAVELQPAKTLNKLIASIPEIVLATFI